MAKNWTVKDLTTSIVNGEINEDLYDGCKRFPLTASLISSIVAGTTKNAQDAFITFAEACPEWLTARKIESVLKKGFSEVEAEEAEEEEKPVKKEKKEKPAKKAKKTEESEDWDI